MLRDDIQRAHADPIVRLTDWLMFRLRYFLPDFAHTIAWNWLCDIQCTRYRKYMGM